MGKGYFSIDNLKGLGNDKFEQLTNLALDSGAAFLSGKVTNVAFKATQTESGQQLTGIAAGTVGIAAIGLETINNSEEIITTLSQDIISESVKIVTREVGRETSQYLLNHAKQLTAFPKNVLSYATTYFMEHKGEADKEALNSIIKSSEIRTKELNEQNKSNKQSEFINNIKTKSSEVIENVNQFVSYATTYMNMITSYLENGPDWVSNQVDKQIDGIVKNVRKNLDDQWNNKDLPAYQEKIESLGTSMGEEMVKKYLNSVTLAQKKAMELIEKTKSKALLKVLQAKATAASKIASLTGVYIPI